MNEIVADSPTISVSGPSSRKPSLYEAQRTLFWYGLLFAAILVGWLLRHERLVNPKEGLGYWLGITGGSLMLFLLFYPAGKKSQLLQRLGMVKHWFRIHIILGLFGPLLVLYHCNFSVGATNSKVALYSMLIVAGSGIIGRHFYTRIHRGLFGKRASIEELRSEISASMENSHGLAAILPGVVNELHTISGDLLGCKYTRSIGVHRSLAWSLKHHFIRFRLNRRISRELRARSIGSDAIRGNAGELRRAANHYVKTQIGLMRQVAQLSFYERLFSLWHIFHMPLFLVLVLSALVHVLAVHMY